MSEKIELKENSKPLIWWLTLLVICTVSIYGRLYMIHIPNVICWDEFHFIKMSTSYINRKFFFDVHPPLGKILLALIGYLSNFKGDSEYKMVGESYGLNFPYVELRMFCSLLSSFLPVLCFCIVWNGTTSLKASLMASVFVLFDNSMILIGRLILLDSMLMFFMVSSFFCFIKSQRYEPTSEYQIIWLMLTGICLGLEISTKLVGLFTMSFYILRFICITWRLLPDKSISLLHLVKFSGMHILCLVVIPFTIYFLIFVIHLDILKYSGTGDYLFSSSFQSHLQGNMFSNLSLPKYVTYKGDVVLRNVIGKSYLNHPVQTDCDKLNDLVTTHPFINGEAFWKFVPFLDFGGNKVKYVTDGDVVRLKHSQSMKLLKRLPFSSFHSSQDVVCTQEMDEVDENHFFRIQIDLAASPGVLLSGGDGSNKDDREWNSDGKIVLKPMKHVFKLVGVDDDCFLQATEWPTILPEHKQASCTFSRFDENVLWYIEWLHDERVEKVPTHIQPMSIWQRFFEMHMVMFKANSELKAGRSSVSSPCQWFLNIPGQPILGPDYVMYLLGTPITWFVSSATILIFLISKLFIMINEQAGSSSASNDSKGKMGLSMDNCLWMINSWFLHYFPFFLMDRPLYFHHYLPSAIFKFMGAGIAIDIFLEMLRECHVHPRIILSVTALHLSMIFHNFQTFSTLTYGLNMTEEKSEHVLDNLRWTSKWKF